MKVHVYEKAWMAGAVGIIVIFVASILFSAMARASAPPSHVETIDPKTARTDPRFAELGVTIHEDGSATVVSLAQMFAFLPVELRVPAHRPVTFRLTSPDVIHGYQIVGTNGNVMVVPGYVSAFTTVFEPGEYLIVCNEYCGTAHHIMQAKLIVEALP
jgi:cytochrome c oxidase subunit II